MFPYLIFVLFTAYIRQSIKYHDYSVLDYDLHHQQVCTVIHRP